MHRSTIRDHALAATVWVQTLADAGGDRLADALDGRVAGLHDDRGSQTAEYAMLGGVSAAACGALVTTLRNPELIRRIVEAVIAVLTKTIRSWA
jgi:hypothetical protein